MKYTLKPLNYAYNVLEPFIDEKTMMIHHGKHYQAYIDNLNAALAKYPELDLSLTQMLSDPSLIPSDIRQTVINNGGGVYNHELFFSLLKVNDNNLPQGQLLSAIMAEFGDFESFVTKFSDLAKGRFGSGWAWLLVKDQKLILTSSANQDTPLNLGTPILALDVWEHAYYLAYQNRRVDYINAFFKVIDWQQVEKLYLSALN